jgi:hypothetical protein
MQPAVSAVAVPSVSARGGMLCAALSSAAACGGAISEGDENMRGYPAAIFVILLAGASSAGCDAVNSARSRLGTTKTDTITTATGSGLALGLQAPPMLHPGDEGVFRLTLTNLTDTAVSHVRLELILPGWAEPMPPRIGDRPVNMSALGDGSTVFAYRLDDAPLASQRVQTIEQRIRVPASIASNRGGGAWTRRVRARLLTADARPLAEVEGQLALDSAVMAALRPSTAADTASIRDQLGSVELGMSAAAVRAATPNARDTAWSHGGAGQRGLLFPVGKGMALAVLSADEVVRIEVTRPTITTAERLGVGSSMAELRAAYGSPCADVNAGRVVVWFATAPGISFAFDAPAPANAAQLRENPDQIAGSARVTRWWLSRGDTCPR